MKAKLLFLFVFQILISSCEVGSNNEQTNSPSRKLWRIPSQSKSPQVPSDSVAFSIQDSVVKGYRLWNGCYTHIWDESLQDSFKKYQYQTIESGTIDSLFLTDQTTGTVLKYGEVKYKCLEETPIANAVLESGGFEKPSYAYSDSVHFRISYSIHPEPEKHDFYLFLSAFNDSSGAIPYSLRHGISVMAGVFDTTIAVAGISPAWKYSDYKFIQLTIAYSKPDSSDFPAISHSNKILVRSTFN